jgi:hypothetical protein
MIQAMIVKQHSLAQAWMDLRCVLLQQRADVACRCGAAVTAVTSNPATPSLSEPSQLTGLIINRVV